LLKGLDLSRRQQLLVLYIVLARLQQCGDLLLELRFGTPGLGEGGARFHRVVGLFEREHQLLGLAVPLNDGVPGGHLPFVLDVGGDSQGLVAHMLRQRSLQDFLTLVGLREYFLELSRFRYALQTAEQLVGLYFMHGRWVILCR